jgi:lipopolysaccharide assembly outer membrane protein LptD (OstA)
MARLSIIFTLGFCLLGLPAALQAQVQEWEIEALNDQGWSEYDPATGIAIGTNGVRVKFGTAVLTADRVMVNEPTGDVVAEGSVRLQNQDQIWTSDNLSFNFKTSQINAEQFRTGQWPVFAGGHGLHGEYTNKVYFATNAFFTPDDVADPFVKIRASRIKIIPGQKIVAHNATLYVGGVPVFYFPFYTRNIGPHANNFNFMPGYRSSFGPFLLGSYTWFLNDELDGILHLDYRERRGVGAGPDLNFHLGRWGDGTIRYYYLNDQDPNATLTNSIPSDRQRVDFSYQANPYTNLAIKSVVRYQSDFAVVREFFEGEYRRNTQPNSYVEVNKFWQNFSLDLYVQPRVNDFLETVERLPEVRLTGFRQQIGSSPLFYESESSAGYYRRLFAETNGPPVGLNYAAARADTYHQVLLPETFFGWLNVTPRVGGRLTYYSEASGPGATTEELYRGVFNTGAEVSFKASRVWPGIQNKFFDVDGIRHIIEPSVNYVYVPTPNYHGTNDIPQFDYELPSLRLLPIEFPDYNAIDSIDSQNVVRLGLHNKIQTKRQGQVVNLVNWDLYTDWRLDPRQDQTTFADLYSDLVLKPRSWLTYESLLRYDIHNEEFRMSYNTLTLQPNDTWSVGLGHYYLRDDLRPFPVGLGEGNNVLTSSIFYRVNDNWGFRMTHYFDARDGRLKEQFYTLYRDLRSWTAALTFRIRDNNHGDDDFTVAFTFSLKAFPRFGLGTDAVKPYSLLGG